MTESAIAPGPDRRCEPVTLLEGLLFSDNIALAMVIGGEENMETRIV